MGIASTIATGLCIVLCMQYVYIALVQRRLNKKGHLTTPVKMIKLQGGEKDRSGGKSVNRIAKATKEMEITRAKS